ncbi:hypothetical protein HWV62_30779 [Athelia sp. TMB]|nr:hypothetical protein HWV62_30779 [Athelia sp. TMB]
MQLAYASGPSAVTNSSCQTGMYHPNISDYSWDDPALFLSAGPSWSDDSTSLAGTLGADDGYGLPSAWNGMFMVGQILNHLICIALTVLQGDGGPDSPDPFHFPDQVDAHGQLTFRSSLKNNNPKILEHQLHGAPLANGGIPPFALAASSPEVPWELLAAIWTAYCYTASTQQLPSPNHEAYTRTTHSTRTLPLDVETDQGTKSRRTYLSKSAKLGSGPYQAVSEARRKRISTRGDTTISSDAHLDNAGQGVGPHRNDRRSRTSERKFDHELADDAPSKPINTYKASRKRCHARCRLVSRPDAILRHKRTGHCPWTNRESLEACKREGCMQRPHTCLALRPKKGPGALCL